jgi:alpha-ketoglutarate-dependent taurine dioxygenase
VTITSSKPLSNERTSRPIQSRRLAGRIGAEVSGVDLATKLDEQTVVDIREVLLSSKVVFFRDQHLDAASQQAFAERFGPLTIAHPTVESIEGEPNVFELDSVDGGRANYWHTDVTFTDRPPTASVLRSVVIPPYGGDTIWANTVAAYEELPDSLRVFADGLRAIHTNQYDYGRKLERERSGQSAGKKAAQFTSLNFETEHPVVRVHPETGDRSLLLGGFARQIIGLSSSESADLIRTLQSHVTRPENTVRWNWRVGDVAMWDNRATQHYAIDDYGDQRRRMQRVTVAGSIPIGIDGRASVALVGDASFYSPVAA